MTSSPYDIIRFYHHHLRQSRISLPPDFDWILQQLRNIETYEAQHPSPQGLCHNDLVRVNLLDDGAIRMLDWEYAGHGNIFFDLASIFIENQLSFEMQIWVLKCYFGQYEEGLLARINRMKPLWLLRDAMWALIQLDVSDIQFDYRGFASKRFAKASKLLANLADTSPPFMG